MRQVTMILSSFIGICMHKWFDFNLVWISQTRFGKIINYITLHNYTYNIYT